MKIKVARILLFVLAAGTGLDGLEAAELRTQSTNGDLWIQFRGDANDDWLLQRSSNLSHWTTVTNFGVLLSGKATNAPWRNAGAPSPGAQFYRGLKTSGLFDPAVFHTVNLSFTQANWAALLSSARNNGSNVYCSMLTLDNGATNIAVGARYKGNTSFITGGQKKSFNLEFDWSDTNSHLMGYTTINLNNAAGDETVMREPVYFSVMSRYVTCPQAALARVHVNGSLWGVFSLAQQENGQLIKEWFSNNEGDRWRTPNLALGGVGFTGSNAALSLINGSTNLATYRPYYDLRTTNTDSTNAWQRLIRAISVLNTAPPDSLRTDVEAVLAVDEWLWFLAIENIFADDDSYWNKGADYSFYWAPEDGRIHPIEHDGNEALSVEPDVFLSPVQGVNSNNRPLLFRLLSVNELRQRYLAHMRTVLQERFNPELMTRFVKQFQDLSIDALLADPNKNYAMAAYTNDLLALKTYVTNRYNFLTTHAELRPLPPLITNVLDPSPLPTAGQVPFITARILPQGTDGIDSVWLYWRDRSSGRFAVSPMFDDGAHGDGDAGDAIYGGSTSNYPAGDKIHYYIEARSANANRAAAFSPDNAEKDTHAYFVAVTSAAHSSVILNEFMAANTAAFLDPQGEFDDWIELHNVTETDVNLTGHYLSDESDNLRKWQFPGGAVIPAHGYLIVWADEDGLAPLGLHASFKLDKNGETIYLVDTDVNFNAILDSVTFGLQTPDLSWGRSGADADAWRLVNPTPGGPNP